MSTKHQIEEEKPVPKLEDPNKEQIQKIFDEDDDDFEEFEQEELENAQFDDKKIDVKQWREDWDDEDLTDEFSIQLQQEIKNLQGQT